MLRPSSLQLWIVLTLTTMSIAACLLTALLPTVAAILVVWVTLTVLDGMFSRVGKEALIADRQLPGRFAIGQSSRVQIEVVNRTRRQLAVELFDGIPDSATAEELPWLGNIPRGQKVQIRYPVTLMQRGRVAFSAVQLLVTSPLSLWQRRVERCAATEVRVYPNYEPLISYALLATAQRIEQMGIIKRNRAGMSREFHQMREYQLGDPLNRIDWKQSARRGELISREYQEQQDQTIILAIDSGQRMRAMDDGVPHFDHCLNAMLLVSYIALRQNDSVGVIQFGGDERWQPPVKGPHQMPVLLNHLYDYESVAEPSDFREASRTILSRQKKRALVIVLTNLRGEDSDDLIVSLAELRRHHLVVLANVREGGVDSLRYADDVDSFDDALNLTAAQLYLDERKAVLQKLQQLGVTTLDQRATQMPIALCNQYLDLKSQI